MPRKPVLRDGVPRSFAIWLMAVLAIVVAVLVWASVAGVRSPEPGPATAWESKARQGSFIVRPLAGEPLPIEATVVQVDAPGRSVVVGAAVLEPRLGPTWDAAEELCVAGAGAHCLVPGRGTVNVRIFMDGTLAHAASVAFP